VMHNIGITQSTFSHLRFCYYYMPKTSYFAVSCFYTIRECNETTFRGNIVHETIQWRGYLLLLEIRPTFRYNLLMCNIRFLLTLAPV